ncbi:uncharacterized protein [Lolium perenne]|uniref:uncharacterized protein n=1 Tax=Lolium perenne TaxID=4522 RepID=UPI0021F555AE|nr:uncharacterized protein LOC127339860 [Lolium perenne]
MCDKSDCDCQSLGVFRGPLVSGSHDFDEHCMFGNDMYLTKGQVDFLNEHCNHFPTEEFEYYVYRMTKSAVIKNKCKLDIGKKFTAKYLKRFIDDAPGNDVTLSLEYTDSNARFKVTMHEHGKGEGQECNHSNCLPDDSDDSDSSESSDCTSGIREQLGWGHNGKIYYRLRKMGSSVCPSGGGVQLPISTRRLNPYGEV